MKSLPLLIACVLCDDVYVDVCECQTVWQWQLLSVLSGQQSRAATLQCPVGLQSSVTLLPSSHLPSQTDTVTTNNIQIKLSTN